jgi:hypothetical protein
MFKGRDFINVTQLLNVIHLDEMSAPSSAMRAESNNPSLPALLERSALNALFLSKVIAHYRPGAGMDSGKGVTLYFPNGRYLIGRPWMTDTAGTPTEAPIAPMDTYPFGGPRRDDVDHFT